MSSAGRMAPKRWCILGSGGDLLTTGEGFYKLRQKFPLDPDALWNSLEGEAEWVGEDGLPEIGSFPPPEPEP